jgi:hypothetical protein
LATCIFDDDPCVRLDAVTGGGQYADHLAVAIGMTAKATAHPFYRGGQQPVLEGRAIPQRARLLHEGWHIVPRIVVGGKRYIEDHLP